MCYATNAVIPTSAIPGYSASASASQGGSTYSANSRKSCACEIPLKKSLFSPQGRMDSITVVGFIAVVEQLVDVTSIVVSYFNNPNDAPKDRAARMTTAR